MRHELESAEVDPLVVPELFGGHVPVVADDLAHVLRRHLLLVHVHEPELALLPVPFRWYEGGGVNGMGVGVFVLYFLVGLLLLTSTAQTG